MNAYYITNFPGYLPVGTSAVVVARDREHAFNLLQAELGIYRLTLDRKDVGPTDFRQLDMANAHAVVLQDGNY